MSFPLRKRPPRKPLAINLSLIKLRLRTLHFRRLRGFPSPSKGIPKPGQIVALALMVLALSSFLAVLPVWSAGSLAVLEVCRAGVEPCQRLLNAPVGEPVALDLIISSSAPAEPGSPLNLVAWETHFRLAGDGDLRLVEQLPVWGVGGKLPVREQGRYRYALRGLVRLEAGTPDPDADYYTVQNSFNEERGQLDYAVTLLGSGKPRPLVSYSPRSSRDRWLIGRIVFSGQSPGSIQVSPNTEAGLAFQAISLSEQGERAPIPLSAVSPLATVRVGLSGGTLDLEGQFTGGSANSSSSMGLVVTFWNPGAVPSWRQGPDKPVAIYRELVSDGNGRFRIADISPEILPPGSYDVRVKSRHSLGSRASRITIPATGSGLTTSQPLTIEWEALRYGDVDANNVVDDADVESLKTSFGRRTGESKFNSQADFNSDRVVDGQDFSLLAQNYLTRSQ